MGRHQRAETLGLISFLICAMVGAIMMSLYMQFAPAIWQITQRRFMVCAGILAGCAALSFCVGYASHSHSLNLHRGWFAPIRRVFEILALSIVYAATVFLSSFALLGAINGMMGSATFSGYLTPICAGFAGVVGYMTFVQAEMMNAKTLASLLPFFVISGVCTAGLTTDDPYWYHNNFGPHVQLDADARRNVHHHRQLLRHLGADHHRTHTASTPSDEQKHRHRRR